jgi:hypothetical protein
VLRIQVNPGAQVPDPDFYPSTIPDPDVYPFWILEPKTRKKGEKGVVLSFL